jgi:D-3-phosphoglycerate dehydrogenase
VVGTTFGHRHRPHLLEAWGSRFNIQLEPNLALFRYIDQPGMIGRVGTIFGEEDVNIVSAAVGAESDGERAVMALTTDAPVNQSTIDRILELEGFSVGRAVSL